MTERAKPRSRQARLAEGFLRGQSTRRPRGLARTYKPTPSSLRAALEGGFGKTHAERISLLGDLMRVEAITAQADRRMARSWSRRARLSERAATCREVEVLVTRYLLNGVTPRRLAAPAHKRLMDSVSKDQEGKGQ